MGWFYKNNHVHVPVMLQCYLPSFITVSIRRPSHALQAKYRSTQATPVECLEGN